ncbi:MAG: Ig-like domain-containing protein [bacterium]
MGRLIKVAAILLLIMAAWQCAQIGSLGGGPKDEKAPEVLRTSPPNNSPNFKGSEFTVYFNEFIQLEEITQKVMISPPLEKLPDFKTKGKALRVRFKEDLKDSTTYSVYFADAIVDLTERNPAMNYTYIFSTGPTVDSMSIAGTVINAFNLEEVQDIYVLLYKDNNDTLPLDSLPLMVKPYYVSKTGEDGRFVLNGLGNFEYLVFALKDMNANYIYDQPGEEIAFLDSLVLPEYVVPPEPDTAALDSVALDSAALLISEKDLQDSLAILEDSIKAAEQEALFVSMINHQLFLFKEVDTNQRLLKAELMRENTIRYSFSRPAEEVRFDVQNIDSDTVWYIQEFSNEKDTLIWYFKDLPVDTIEVVMLLRGDTLGHEYILSKPRESLGERRKKKDEEQKEYLGYTTNTGGRALRLDRQAEMIFNQPIDTVLTDSILLIRGEDSTYGPSYIYLDSNHRKIRFPLELEESLKYSLIFPDSTFIDWNGRFNKGGSIRFNTLSLADYGVLKLKLIPEIEQPHILQLMTEKEILISEYYFSKDTNVIIDYVDPGKYILKLIFDDNGNHKWDPGNYIQKRQPEQVLYYNSQLDVRGNWDIEETWLISR